MDSISDEIWFSNNFPMDDPTYLGIIKWGWMKETSTCGWRSQIQSLCQWGQLTEDHLKSPCLRLRKQTRGWLVICPRREKQKNFKNGKKVTREWKECPSIIKLCPSYHRTQEHIQYLLHERHNTADVQFDWFEEYLMPQQQILFVWCTSTWYYGYIQG